MDRITKNRLGRIHFVALDAAMAQYTPYKVGGKAEALAMPQTEEQVLEILRFVNQHNVPHFFLGNGSNILISDLGYDGVVIKLGKEFEKVTINGTIVNAGAAADLWTVIRMTALEGLSGLEALSGIPGSLGGALFMNAGAYGKTISDHLVRVRCIDPETLRVSWIDQATIQYEYRGSAISLYHLWAEFLLDLADVDKVKIAVAQYLAKRRQSQPLSKPSAGCVFKNPPGLHAGLIIDELGLKGLAVGGAEVSSDHANFIVNTGGATASDIYELMNIVKKTVKIRTDVELELEVQLKGSFTEFE